jgi:uncharacterized membrane protein (DUF485 family)
MTWTLFLAWSAVFAFASDHARSARNFRGASQAFETMLGLSALLALVATLVLLVWIGWATAWWWAPVLFATASIGGGLALGFAQSPGARLVVTLAGFIAWPFFAGVCVYLLLAD